jgi:pimeloyl-ACP methyl ester carboxylesterase
MDANGIERAHLVGWSNGGAVALNACGLAPDRVASLTLLAAIACQETEGTGDFYFEHAKYAVGYAGLVALPELIPHFGLFFPREYPARVHPQLLGHRPAPHPRDHGVARDADPHPARPARPLVSDWAAERTTS